jgi:hypothetical protein
MESAIGFGGRACKVSGFSRATQASTQGIVGGSGASYEFLQDAIDGEQGSRQTDTSQAGTIAGKIIGSIVLSGNDDFYIDYWAINMAPNPPVASKVVSYDGTLKSLVLADNVNFGVGTSYLLVEPAIISLYKSVNEAIEITKPLLLNMNGYRNGGTLDFNVGEFLWIKGGSGILSKGLLTVPASVIIIENLTIMKRTGQLWSINVTSGAGRTNLIQTNVENIGTVIGL